MVKGLDLGKAILYGGAIILAYLVLRSWGIIQSTGSQQDILSNRNNISTWEPLSDNEIQNIRSIIDYNKIELVRQP